MRFLGSKVKLSRKLGVELGFKTPGTKTFERLMRRLNVRPGQHGRSRKRFTEYGLQLLEKQRLRYMFLINENQLRRYFNEAISQKGNTALILCQILEKRLDNVVYRLGFAPTRTSARQLVSHGHIKVNGKVVNIPSYRVKVGDIIEFKSEKSQQIPYVKEALENKDLIIPAWLKRTGVKGEVISDPTDEDISRVVDLRKVVDFYSR